MSDVPASDADQKLGQVLDHSYDGIQEYDNPTPGWWSAVFVATVMFSAMYFMYYHLRPDATSVRDEYDDAVASNLQKQWGKMGTLGQDQNSLLAYMQNKDYMLMGRTVFKSNCVSCHGPQGAGLVGPNLTDDYYKNIKVLGDIPRVINNGANGGQMPSWKSRLHPNEVALVAAYVASLRGQNLPGRPPEGDKIAPWPDAPASPASAAPAPATK